MKDTSCICQACNKDIIRKINDENYVPRWSLNSTQCCIVSTCTNTSIIKTTMATTGEVEALLKCSIKAGIETVTLCTSHYKELHHTLKADIYEINDKCSSCNITLKHKIDKIRRSPNAMAINKYYGDRGIEMSFNDESKLCNKCYTVQLNIIHYTEPISEDSKLCMLMHEIQAIEKLNSIDGALLEMVNKIGNFLLNRVGILLPEAYQEFLNTAMKHSNNATDIEAIKVMLPKRCFLNRLLSFLVNTLILIAKLDLLVYYYIVKAPIFLQ